MARTPALRVRFAGVPTTLLQVAHDQCGVDADREQRPPPVTLAERERFANEATSCRKNWRRYDLATNLGNCGTIPLAYDWVQPGQEANYAAMQHGDPGASQSDRSNAGHPGRQRIASLNRKQLNQIQSDPCVGPAARGRTRDMVAADLKRLCDAAEAETAYARYYHGQPVNKS